MAGSTRNTEKSARQLFGTPVLRARRPALPMLVRQYSVVGQYGDAGPADFVRHVAILKDDQRVGAAADVNIYHTGPPVVAGEASAAAPFARRSCRADIAADIGLHAEEREAIRDWIAEVEKEDRSDAKPFQQFVVMPHVTWVKAPETGRRIRRRFSCAGFVIECYRAAAITIIDADAQLPEVDEQLLLVAYPHLAWLEHADDRVKDRRGFKDREDLGLHGNGPWRVLLAGYVFHSLKRTTVDGPRPLPYVPRSSSEGSFSG